jgi:hypothetical protein
MTGTDICSATILAEVLQTNEETVNAKKKKNNNNNNNKK